ncbi:MAG: excinuclease ABC subunit UvrA [Candidatus Dormibacter sp.]|uniref:excinuclease ABC subunit UvrA n=1 Tax=Candidatus Dormibacter sp. TaxID=2973982 RepID=UPI000DB8B0CF|nr:MAG: excinuclease ABC subunit UvrA [Candidatus Dormibacteraeota bacterium]
MANDQIVVRGAREHNLKDVTLAIPRDKLVVFTGLSGSGKSSLAFDTIYAEGRRRYVESLSAYARQFLGQMEKPDVDAIDGLSPAISIDQKGTSRNPRSTVGTVTEVYDYLRLLYARVGHPHCPICGREIAKQTIEQMADQVEKLPEGTRLMILGPVVRGRKGEYDKLLEDIRKQGFSRVRVDGTLYELGAEIPLERYKQHDIEVVVDRVVVGPDQRMRLVDSLEIAAKLGQGSVLLVHVVRPGAAAPAEVCLSQDYACPYDGHSVPEPQPRNFSFNTPHGACPTCTGLGMQLVADAELVIPDPSLTLRQGAIAPWSRSQFFYPEMLEALCEAAEIDMDLPVQHLSRPDLDLLLNGSGKKKVRFSYRNQYRQRRHYEAPFEGILANVQRRYDETESEFLKQELGKYLAEKPCPACGGARLKPDSLAVTVAGRNIADVCRLAVTEAVEFADKLRLSEREETIARGILKEIRERLRFLIDVGLDYLSLERAANTLSGGESQRIRLATQIGSKLMGVLYILDEPSIGLHQRDNRRLIQTLVQLRDLGNTLIVVEHDEETIMAADWMVDIGPGAGEHGGVVVAQGPVQDVVAKSDSLTARYLRGDLSIALPRSRRPGNGKELVIRGAAANNLRGIDVRLPLGCFICVAGVSGSGKSSLISDVLARKLGQHFFRAKDKPGRHDRIDGLEHLDKAIQIDQSPIGRTPRSNPATYTGMFTSIRELFAQLPEAKVRGYGPGRFSFNVKGGRCEACQGDGIIQIEMQFLPDVYVQCEVCQGTRYTREVQEVKFRGHSISEVLAMTVDEANEVFENVPRILSKLKTLRDVGLGYIRLGQPATQLSGGEAQRVKLSTELSRRDTGKTIYVLDEPTTGLHYADVERLLHVLHRLVEHGNTVVVIEHNLDVLKTADWIVDLGPEGGGRGGDLVAEGTPEEVAVNANSYTGTYLRRVLERAQPHLAAADQNGRRAARKPKAVKTPLKVPA